MINRFSVIATTLTVATLALGTVLSVSNTATAQRIVTCESENGRYTTCPMATQGGVRLVERLSDATCRGNWGWKKGYVWVDRGCRAKFIRNNR